MQKAVFLDRDGVLVQHLTERGPRETPHTPEEVKLFQGVQGDLARLKDAGYLLVVVTNQPDVAKGKVTAREMQMIEERFHSLLGSAAKLDGYYACLHHPDAAQAVVKELLQDCDCRKPKPGLILQATRELEIDLSLSWLVGDQPTDVEAGLTSGIKPSRLILVGYQTKAIPYLTAASITDAVNIILETEKR